MIDRPRLKQITAHCDIRDVGFVLQYEELMITFQGLAKVAAHCLFEVGLRSAN
jgi:hypothetical protein